MNTITTNAAMPASTNDVILYEMRDGFQKKIDAINSLLKIKEEMAVLHREYMAKMAEFNTRLTENPFFSTFTKGAGEMIAEVTSAEVVESKQSDDKEMLALPEISTTAENLVKLSTPKAKRTASSIKKEKKSSVVATKKSVFDNPAFKKPYNPVASKNTDSSSNEGDVHSFEDIFSNDSTKSPVKGGRKGTITMDECLSDKPIDRILCAGILNPEYKFKQHERICLSDGIFPTITAGGNTAYVNV